MIDLLYEVICLDFIERLDKLMDESGLNKHTLSQKSGVPYSTINSFYTKGYENIKLSTLSKIAQSLGTTIDYLALGERVSSDFLPIKKRKIPLLGEIAAGIPIYANEDHEAYVEVNADINADFALRVKGDSMNGARIYNGDIVFVRQQSSVNTGEIAVVIIDDDATLKRFYQNGNTITLVSENSAFPPMVIHLDEASSIRILGKAVAFQSDVK